MLEMSKLESTTRREPSGGPNLTVKLQTVLRLFWSSTAYSPVCGHVCVRVLQFARELARGLLVMHMTYLGSALTASETLNF